MKGIALAMLAAMALPSPQQRIAALSKLEVEIEQWVNQRVGRDVTRMWLPLYGLWLSIEDDRLFERLETKQAHAETLRIHETRQR